LGNGVIGLLGVLPGVPVSRVATAFYSASLTVDPQTEHITEMFGAYMLTVGVLAGFAAFRPEKYQVITFSVAAMLTLRTVQRIVFASEQSDVFGISGFYYWAQTAVFFMIGAALAWLAWKFREGTSQELVDA
jgi:membrane protein implicated in regulation of membrane protease activity